MLGASGAIYGILMAFGMVFPNMEIMLLFPPIPIKAKYMVFVLGFITYAMDSSGGVAHTAHFGWCACGVLPDFLLAKSKAAAKAGNFIKWIARRK